MRILFVLAAAAASLLPAAARAQTATGQFAVRAEVRKDCQIQTRDLNFGIYAPAQASTANTSFTLTCTPGTRAVVSLSAGNSGNPQQRFMRHEGGSSFNLNYQMYTDAALQNPINTAGQAWEITEADNATGAPITRQIYGQIPASQVVGAGNYTDMIQVTVQY